MPEFVDPARVLAICADEIPLKHASKAELDAVEGVLEVWLGLVADARRALVALFDACGSSAMGEFRGLGTLPMLHVIRIEVAALRTALVEPARADAIFDALQAMDAVPRRGGAGVTGDETGTGVVVLHSGLMLVQPRLARILRRIGLRDRAVLPNARSLHRRHGPHPQDHGRDVFIEVSENAEDLVLGMQLPIRRRRV